MTRSRSLTLWLLLASLCAGAVPLRAQQETGPTVGSAQPPASFSKRFSYSVLQDYPKGESLDEVREDFRLMKELGVITWRGSFSWIDYEPRAGSFDLSWLRSFLDLAAREGITLRPYLGYTPAWAARGGKDQEAWNDPPKRMADWRRYVSRIVSETRAYRNIASFEIYNEENVKQWWDGPASDYNDVLRTGAVAVKTLVPATEVIFGGMVYPDAEWIDATCHTHGNSKAFDILPFHAYPETWTPRDITVENYLDQGRPGYFNGVFVKLVDEECDHQPLWINEAGFATSPGKTEQDQANWWARAIATFSAEPRIEHLGIYQIRDRKKSERVIGEDENYYLGITRSDRTKKMAFHLLKRLLPLLNTGYITVAGAELSVDIVDGKPGELYHHLFVRPDGGQVLFVWDKTEDPTLRLRARPGTTVIEYHLDGTASPYDNYDGRALNEVALTAGTVRIFEIRR